MWTDFEVLQAGEDNGNHTIVRFELKSGRRIYGLATPNFYGGEWDLGPTWNYLITGDKPYLMDAGRYGQGRLLIDMMHKAGFKERDLKAIIISHGHEDHDGGLHETAALTGAKVAAHPYYRLLTQFYPDETHPQAKTAFPASCWHCPMPASFSDQHCLVYHKERAELPIEDLLSLNGGIAFLHTPGHSPDAIAALVDDEALLVGDTLLPDITPQPTREDYSPPLARILHTLHPQPELFFGLVAYLSSLRTLREQGDKFPDLQPLPGHRLYYSGKWNFMTLKQRVRELVEHHIERSAAILAIAKERPKSVEEIAQEHFPPSLLKGYGIIMAVNEIVSHMELLIRLGDLTTLPEARFTPSGTSRFERFIRDAVLA